MALFTSVCVFALMGASAHAIQVNTTEGILEGYKAGDGDYYEFYGVPYGGPTSGENRFKGPVPPARYPGILHANDRNIICAQPTERGLVGVENCLFLNIFTRNITTPKPVIVWLNSQEYTNSETQQFSFKRFVEEDVVFVSMNFRLSVFGFLCLGVQDAPGNAGLRDILQGLRWINANIANFGGNPGNVVLMGHASGGALVDLLTMSPQALGLVHKAVALSGSALAPWAVAYDPIGYANLLGAKLGYGGKSNEDLAKHLVTTDLSVLQTALNDFSFKNNTPLFAPCIENVQLNPNNTVLSNAPINFLKSGNYLPLPYLAGYTTREGTMRASEAALGDWLQAMAANFSDFLPVDLKLDNDRASVAAAIRDVYFGSTPISVASIEDYLDYHGDTLVVVSVIRGARERSLQSVGNVRLLEFGYVGTQNTGWTLNQIPLNGVRHGGLLNYLFDYDLKPVDEVVMRSVVSRFTAFAKTGTPNIVSANFTPTWEPITRDQLNYFYYGGSDLAIVNQSAIHIEETRFNPHNTTMNFWNDLLTKYYEPPKSVSSAGKVLSSIVFVIVCQWIMSIF